MPISRYLPFASRTTDVQAVTYLLAVCLFSISFLVFLNSSVSFVITDLIGIKEGVGDLVGTLVRPHECQLSLKIENTYTFLGLRG